jgi:ribosomal protein S18 acetylase RimI-like enzyme
MEATDLAESGCLAIHASSRGVSAHRTTHLRGIRTPSQAGVPGTLSAPPSGPKKLSRARHGHLASHQRFFPFNSVHLMPVPSPSPAWRLLAETDLPALAEIAARVHPDFPEDDAIFAERLALAPDWCFALADGKSLYGYILSHPWDGPPPKLDTLLGALPDPPTHGYVHDLALLPEVRGGGHGRLILNRLISQAKSQHFGAMALVAVSGSAPFWQRQGFRITAPPGPLTGYGTDARYMLRDLTA